MTGIPTPEEIEAAQAALQAQAQNEPKQETGSTTADIIGGALDIAGTVTIDVAGAVVQGVGTVAMATGEAVVTVIGGIFDGLSS
jgi:acyl-coenzyme A thioesterase PaaI-like protein